MHPEQDVAKYISHQSQMFLSTYNILIICMCKHWKHMNGYAVSLFAGSVCQRKAPLHYKDSQVLFFSSNCPIPVPFPSPTLPRSFSLMSFRGLWAVKAFMCYWSWWTLKHCQKLQKQITKGMSGRSGSNKTEEIRIIHVLCSHALTRHTNGG